MVQTPDCLHRGRLRGILTHITLLVTFLVLAGCATPVAFRDVPPAAELQWPGKGSSPKIVWVRNISGYEDVGITKGFWKKALEFIIGGDDRRIVRPHGVLFDAAERLYIADPGGGVVHCMDTAKGLYTIIGAEEGSPLRTPIGLAEDNQGRIYITDSAEAKVFRYDPADGSLKPFLSGMLSRPTGIVFNKFNGLLYIVDTTGQRVIATDLEGRERHRFGSSGEGPGQFNYPTDIATDRQGRLYITDSLNFRIRTFSAAGAQLGRFGEAGDSMGDLQRPKGIAVDSAGHIYVCDGLLDAVQIFDATGRLLLFFGRQGAGTGEFRMPSGIFIDQRDYIYVADTYNQRIQVFKYMPGAEPLPVAPLAPAGAGGSSAPAAEKKKEPNPSGPPLAK